MDLCCFDGCLMALASDGAMQAQSVRAANQVLRLFCQEVDFFDAGPENQGSIVLKKSFDFDDLRATASAGGVAHGKRTPTSSTRVGA